MCIDKKNLLKFLDKIIGIPLSLILPRTKDAVSTVPAASGTKEIKKILLIRPGGIGDLVLLIPLIRTLRRRFPGTGIDLVCEKRNAEITSLIPGEISSVYLYDRIFPLFRVFWNSYDIVIDTEQWYRLSALTAYFTGAPVRIGFSTNSRKKLFTHKIPYSLEDHEIYNFLRLAAPLTGEIPGFDPDKPFIDLPEKPASSLPGPAADENRETIVIAPGATARQKAWSAEKFGEAAQKLTRWGYKIILTGSSGDRQTARKIKKAEESCMDLTGKTSLKETAFVIRSAAALITTDSGLMHLAFAVGTPTVSLFGASDRKKWAPTGRNHAAISKEPKCGPCARFGHIPRCGNNFSCMSSITVSDVMDAIEKILPE